MKVVMLCVCTKTVCVRFTELVCKAVRLAFSCQTSSISFPFIPIPCYFQIINLTSFLNFSVFYINLFYFIALLLHKDSLRIVLYNVYFIVSFYWYSRHYRHKTFISFIEIACYVILTLFYTKKKV